MQRRLLSETDLTLAKTLEVAQGLEAAENNLKIKEELEQKPIVTVRKCSSKRQNQIRITTDVEVST